MENEDKETKELTRQIEKYLSNIKFIKQNILENVKNTEREILDLSEKYFSNQEKKIEDTISLTKTISYRRGLLFSISLIQGCFPKE